MDTSPLTVRLALVLNAGLSLLTGTLLAAQPGRVGDWLGVEVDGWLRLLGIALLGHGVALIWAAQDEARNRWARMNLLMIAPYPVLMILVVVTGLVDRPLGQGLALADGVAVGTIAILHVIGLRIRQPKAHAQVA